MSGADVIIHNVDEDEQSEMILCADERLVIYDGRDQFEEWRSDQGSSLDIEEDGALSCSKVAGRGTTT